MNARSLDAAGCRKSPARPALSLVLHRSHSTFGAPVDSAGVNVADNVQVVDAPVLWVLTHHRPEVLPAELVRCQVGKLQCKKHPVAVVRC